MILRREEAKTNLKDYARITWTNAAKPPLFSALKFWPQSHGGTRVSVKFAP